jgi:hypothetical protein
VLQLQWKCLSKQHSKGEEASITMASTSADVAEVAFAEAHSRQGVQQGCFCLGTGLLSVGAPEILTISKKQLFRAVFWKSPKNSPEKPFFVVATL